MNRVRSDALRTLDARLVGHGAIDRPAIELPDDVETGSERGASAGDAPVPAGEVVRIVLDGATRHCRFERYAGGVRATGVFETPAGARSPGDGTNRLGDGTNRLGDGTNRLGDWIEATDLALGRTVHLDVIEPGFAYGLRAPGESAVYDAPSSGPDDSLASIAEELDGEG